MKTCILLIAYILACCFDAHIIKYNIWIYLFIWYCFIFKDLFLKLVPYHCLGCLWSQRDKKGKEGACWSVRATIKQFNRLTNAVTASCLWNTGLKSQQRARLLEKWISVAEVRAHNLHTADVTSQNKWLTAKSVVCLPNRPVGPGRTSHRCMLLYQPCRVTPSTEWERPGRRQTGTLSSETNNMGYTYTSIKLILFFIYLLFYLLFVLLHCLNLRGNMQTANTF